MKRKINVRSHLRRTRRGPRMVHRHNRNVRAKMAGLTKSQYQKEWERQTGRKVKKEIVPPLQRAKMAEWESDVEQIHTEKALERIRKEQEEDPSEKSDYRRGLDLGEKMGFEHALKMANLIKDGELKPFKRAKMARAQPVEIRGRSFTLPKGLSENKKKQMKKEINTLLEEYEKL